MSYLVQPRDQIFVKGQGFWSFAKNIDKNVGKNVSKTGVVNTAKNVQNVRCTESHFRNSIQKTAEATDDLIGNKIANKITKKIHNRIILKQLKINMIKKYLKNDYISIKEIEHY